MPRPARTAAVVIAVAVAWGTAGAALGGASGTSPRLGRLPGALFSVPGVGQVSWSCDAARRVSATFTAARPVTTTRVTLTGDGAPLATATLGVRTHRLAAPLRHWRVLRFHVVQRTEPATVGATATLRFRGCLVPSYTLAVRTHSHARAGT